MLFEWDFLAFVAAPGVAAFTPGPGLAAIVATVLAGGVVMCRRPLFVLLRNK